MPNPNDVTRNRERPAPHARSLRPRSRATARMPVSRKLHTARAALRVLPRSTGPSSRRGLSRSEADFMIPHRRRRYGRRPAPSSIIDGALAAGVISTSGSFFRSGRDDCAVARHPDADHLRSGILDAPIRSAWEKLRLRPCGESRERRFVSRAEAVDKGAAAAW